jgi:hypothetical protein
MGDGEGSGEGVYFWMIEPEKFLGWSESDEVALVQESDALAEEESFADVVRDEDDGFIETAGEGAELTLKLGAGDGIEGSERLVHEKDGRIGGKSTRDADTLALAAGELAWAAGVEFAGIETNETE